jgi:hypothetical protein
MKKCRKGGLRSIGRTKISNPLGIKFASIKYSYSPHRIGAGLIGRTGMQVVGGPAPPLNGRSEANTVAPDSN